MSQSRPALSTSLSLATASGKQSFVSQIYYFGILILLPVVSGWIQFWQLLSCYLTQMGRKKEADYLFNLIMIFTIITDRLKSA